MDVWLTNQQLAGDFHSQEISRGNHVRSDPATTTHSEKGEWFANRQLFTGHLQRSSIVKPSVRAVMH